MKKIWFLLILAGCSQADRIIDSPINFDDERISLTLEYLEQRYGLQQDDPTIDPKMIVIHYTVIPTFQKTIDAFDPSILPDRPELLGAGALNVSSQFLVDQDGSIHRLMPENYMARHTIGLNHCAIGIENVGGTEEVPLTEEQLKANIWLVKYLKKKYDIQYLIGHQEYRLFEDHALWLEKDDNYRTVKSDPGIEFMEGIRSATDHLGFLPLPGDDNSIDRVLFEDWEKYREKTLNVQRIKHKDLQPLIDAFRGKSEFEVRKVGESIEGRNLSLISIGEGGTDVFLWSQMHGNEPTATMSIFDILNFMADKSAFVDEKENLLKKVKLHFLPMLNPDGAELFRRRNALEVDINRDALRLQTPEGQTLKRVRDSLDAEFGFNLHDQSRYNNVERTAKPATLSYLAPAYNYEKEVNDVRANAMKVIVYMNRIIQKYAPGQVGRYDDTFEPRAFGDNVQKWGTSAILIESGGQYNDPEKQFIRQLNYMSILSAIFTIADGSYEEMPLEEYETIPWNNRMLFDLKIENMTFELDGTEYILDLGINLRQVDNNTHDRYHYVGSIVESGDLSTYYGYQTIDATGLKYVAGNVNTNLTYNRLEEVDFKELFSQGITDIKLPNIPAGLRYSEYPINLTLRDDPNPETIRLGNNATFLLKDEDGATQYMIVNGFAVDPEKSRMGVGNGIIR
jgi:hypothetical protein